MHLSKIKLVTTGNLLLTYSVNHDQTAGLVFDVWVMDRDEECVFMDHATSEVAIL